MNSGLILRKAIEAIERAQDRELYEGKLIDFAEYVWPIVEPAIPFIKGWAIEAIADHLQAVTEGHIRRLLINVPPGFTKSLMTDVFWPAYEWGPRNMPWLRYMCAAYSNHLTERDNMRCRNIVVSDRYKHFWGSRFKISNEQFTKIKFANDQTGWKLATSVGGIGTGERADRVIIDDPNNPMEMESEAVRNTAIMWFTEIIPDRLNSQKDSAIVVIQQRTHEDDVSGTALSREMGYTHLMIPMRHDPARHCTTIMGFDPKTGEDKIWEDPRTEEEELAWPERFPPQIVDDLERDKGPYAWCNSGEAPVLMGDLSLKRIDEIKEGDEIVGFETGNKEKRARLKPAKVLSISRTWQPVVKMILDSGEVIRCTANHKWFTGRLDKTHKMYAPAKLGSVLRRVCPAKIEQPETMEEARLLGWLGGFFDGEGSVSLLKRRRGDYGNSLITFTQSSEKNLHLCQRLEYALSRFGFSFGYKERTPVPLSASSAWQKRRSYYLKSDIGEGLSRSRQPLKRANRLGLNQKFLHLVKPLKWRQRLIDSTVNGRMYTSGERVVSIKPDGSDFVYGLETTTGNYVVWGLASSNSGQYQQSPAPRGGSILKDHFWQLWDQDKYPQFEFLLASLDTAMTDKSVNDPSALTVWGVFREDKVLDVEAEALWMPRNGQALRPVKGNPKVMLLWAWREHLDFGELVQKVINTCVPSPAPVAHPRFPVDHILIESKANGHAVANELERLFRGSGRLGIEIVDPKQYGDKTARAISIQHIFSDGMVYAPDKAWADKVIKECALFPRGSTDDLVDTVTQAIRWLRETGFVLKRSEHALVEEEELTYHNVRPLYPMA